MLNYNFMKSLLDYSTINNKQIIKLIWPNIAYVRVLTSRELTSFSWVTF